MFGPHLERERRRTQTTGHASGFLMVVSVIVTGVVLRRHVASLESELTWFSVKFVPYSVNYSISV